MPIPTISSAYQAAEEFYHDYGVRVEGGAADFMPQHLEHNEPINLIDFSWKQPKRLYLSDGTTITLLV